MKLLPGLLEIKAVKEAAGESVSPVNCFINSHLGIDELLYEMQERRKKGKPVDQLEIELRLRGIKTS